MRWCYPTLLAAIIFSPVFLVQAQTCGNIIGPSDSYPYNTESVPVVNCSDPFKVTANPPSPYTLVVQNHEYQNGAVIPVVGGVTNEISASGTPAQMMVQTKLYKHNGGNYEYIDLEPTQASPDYYRQYATTYFTNSTDRAFYIEIYDFQQGGNNADSYFYNEDGTDKLDPSTGETINERLNNFYQAAENSFVPLVPTVGAGTYTLVIIESSVYLNYQSIWDKIRQYVLPTAYAQFYFTEDYVYTLTFTLTEVPPEPQGASSVLFLPGIQASRLYAGEAGNNRIWEPSGNTDVSSLALTEEGMSTSDIRTNDIIDETSIPYIGDNIYKDFINFMNDLVDTKKVIKEWTPFAYDWRYDVFDIAKNGTKYLDGSIKNPTDEVIRLASSSLSKKVTIIAHSNGGLLAKAIMLELKARGRDNLVDNIIFIGTPQLGTPKAIATILHGYDQEALGGLIIDDGVARNVIRNLPGAYSLLPSEKYQELVSTPLVRFDNSLVTGNSLSGYGPTIDSIGELNAFMNGLEDSVGRTNLGLSEVNKPIKVNSTMYFDALLNHKQKLDNWVPPTTTKVFQIVGTGLATIESIEYREIAETICPFTAVSLLLCSKVKMLKPRAHFTAYGDETVVSKSAGFISGGFTETHKIYLDLGKIEDDRPTLLGDKKLHSNLTEIVAIQEKISDILKIASTSQFQYLFDNEPVSNKTYDITEINSPVQLFTKDAQGRITGMVKENGILVRKEEIPDSIYIEFGTTKYLIVPADIKSTTTLSGEAWGGYTMTLSTIDSGNRQIKKHEIVNATTTPTMKATFTKSLSTGYGQVETDLNGDGVIDSISTVDGVNIPIVPAYSYSVLISTITALQIQKVPKDVLLALTKQAQAFRDKTTNKVLNTKLEKLTLALLQSTVTLYQRNKILTKVAADNLLVIINFLSK